MKQISQKQWVKRRLIKYGRITRNQCLDRYISRLGAIIFSLKKDGYVFLTKYIDTAYGRDYVYKLIKKPNKK